MPDFRKSLLAQDTKIERDFYLNEECFTGFKITLTFNPRIYSLGQSWTKLDELWNEFATMFEINNNIMVYFVRTVEAMQSNYAHIHAVVYTKECLDSYPENRIAITSSGKKKLSWLDRFSIKWGRLECVSLTRQSRLDMLKRMGLKINVESNWFEYITKNLRNPDIHHHYWQYYLTSNSRTQK